MPVRFKPGQSIPLTLKADRKDANPAKFFVRSLTGAEAMDFAELFDRANVAKKSGRDAIKYLFDSFRSVLLSWSGLVDEQGAEIPYDPSKLEDLIGINEVRELIGYCIAGGVTEEDLGK